MKNNKIFDPRVHPKYIKVYRGCTFVFFREKKGDLNVKD